jgi:hypothetical protein
MIVVLVVGIVEVIVILHHLIYKNMIYDIASNISTLFYYMD